MAILVSSKTPKSDKNRLSTTWECFNDAKAVTGLTFVLDAAAEPETSKCAHYITPEEDALSISWGERLSNIKKSLSHVAVTREPIANQAIWCNPPFDSKLDFIQKAYDESKLHRVSICLLIPYEPQTIWWRCMVDGIARTVYEPRGRYNFYEPDGVTPKTGSNFGTCFVLFDGSYINDTNYVKFTPSELPVKNQRVDLISLVKSESNLSRTKKRMRALDISKLNRG